MSVQGKQVRLDHTPSNYTASSSQLEDHIEGIDDALGAGTFKSPVTVVATSDLTLSGEQTIDGVLTSTSRVLLTGQSTSSENGIYVTAAGAWARASDLDTGIDAAGVYIPVNEGTLYADSLWRVTSDSGSAVVGTDSLTVAQFFIGSENGPLNTVFDLGGFVPGVPVGSSVVVAQQITKPLVINADDPGTATSDTAPIGASSFDIQINNSSVGSIAFSAGVATGTVSWTGATSISAGDRLEIIAPASPDAFQDNYSFIIKAYQEGQDDDYTIQTYVPSIPTASEVVLSYVAPRAIAINEADNGSSSSEVATTGSTTYDIQVNGASVGSVAYGAAATEGTVSWTGSRSIAVGDLIQILAPGSPDATHTDIFFTLNADEFGTTAYDLVLFFPDALGSGNETIFRHTFARDVILDRKAIGQATSDTATTAETIYTINCNGSAVGTITYAASATDGTIEWNSDAPTLMSAGDTLSIVGPSTADTTHAGISIALKGEYATRAIVQAAEQYRHQRDDLRVPALVTTADGDPASASALSHTPINGAIVVSVNGIREAVGDGVKTEATYFSSNGGSTAKSLIDIVAGDILYWNGSVAGYELDTDDLIDYDYEYDLVV